MFGHKVTPDPSEFHLRHNSLTDRAWSSPTRFADVMARRKAALHDSHLSSARARGSKGGPHRASNTILRSHVGTLGALGGCNLQAPLRNWDTRLWLPTVPLSILICCQDMAAT